MQPDEILNFWLQAGPQIWFKKDDAFDQSVKEKFQTLPDQIVDGQYDHWQTHPNGMLASVLALDQFPRNIHRGTARAFAYDETARKFAKTAIDQQWDQQVSDEIKAFFYLPFMHSEDINDQHFCLNLYRKADDEQGVGYARRHLELIEKYGRFPHRNALLGRKSTLEEEDYLSTEGAGF